MTITAIVLDSGMEPLSDDMEITADDYSVAEQFAAEAAANGTKCCIQWTRSEDGQTAYWGPAGAVFKPHWYVRMGRPELPPEERTKPRTIWMSEAEWVKVQSAPKGWVRGLVQRAEAEALHLVGLALHGDDVKVLEAAVAVVSRALDDLVGACTGADGKPCAPYCGAVMRARAMLPPACKHALKKA